MTKKQAQIILEYNEQLWEIEDEYLEYWLENGMPDGTTEEELINDYTTEDFVEWSQVANDALGEREAESGICETSLDDEINKLDDLLNEANANYERTINGVGFDQIVLFDQDGNKLDDAIFGEGSHGYEEGLLETQELGGCDGYETAEEIFNGWKEMFKEAFE